MNTCLLIGCLLATGALAAPAKPELFGLGAQLPADDLELFDRFQGFVQTHGKQYAHLDEARERFQIYKSNHLMARMYQDMEQGSAVYGETRFMDLSAEEFERTHLSAAQPSTQGLRQLSQTELNALEKDEQPAKAFDFRDQGLVGPVKDQGHCGSCWSFSVTGNLEGLWKKKTGQLLSFSEQFLIDCDVVDKGCNGGLMENTYLEIQRLGGVPTEESYPYEAKDAHCRKVDSKLVAYVNDSVILPHDELKIQKFLLKNGPLAVAVNANPLQFYKSGIHHPLSFMCPPKRINHAVLLVGWGEEAGKPYWIVKNSWAETFGEKGYFRLYRGENVCGIAEYATTAVVL